MARYIKANPKVAQYLRLENDRNRVKDGNYLLWQADMTAFGRLTQLSGILQTIGGISLQAHEAREEQDGTVVRPLPVATDARFIVETGTGTDNETGGTDTETETAADTATEESGEGAA